MSHTGQERRPLEKSNRLQGTMNGCGDNYRTRGKVNWWRRSH